MYREGMRRLAAAMAVLFAATFPAPAASPESDDPIVFALNDWDGQRITSRIMGGILEKAGYKVEYRDANYEAQFEDLGTGKLTVAMEIWATTGTQNLEAAVATGNVENIGPTGMQAKEDWWFPAYMVERCPGLPDWRALLKPECAKAFSTNDSTPKGFYLGGPSDWGGHDEGRIEALKLPFTMNHAETDTALWEALQTAYSSTSAIMLWIYSPHWAPAEFNGDWVKFPAYEPACYSDPTWGINPKALFDCGKPTGPIWKAGWIGLKKKWPGAHKAIAAYQMTNDEMEQMLVAVERKGKTVQEVVNEWIAQNEPRWRAWIKG